VSPNTSNDMSDLGLKFDGGISGLHFYDTEKKIVGIGIEIQAKGGELLEN